MAKFRCKASGNIVEFTYEVDIKSTRRNKAYEEVISVEGVIETPAQDVKDATPQPTKKVGRPSTKVATEASE
jgi:hypothetical protein